MFSDVYYANPKGNEYVESDDNEYYTPEAELVDISSGSVVNQGVYGHGSSGRHDKHYGQNIILSNDDNFGYVFKPEGLGRSTGIETPVVIQALVGISMALIVSLAAFVYWKRQKMLREKAVIARNLESFDIDDINVKRAPSGGYHGFYSGDGNIDHQTLLKRKFWPSSSNDTASEESYEEDAADAILAPVEYSDNYDDTYYSNNLQFTEGKNEAIEKGDVII